MTCPGCGSAHQPGAKFCSECGQSLPRGCPSCGELDVNGKFCHECGAALGGAAPAAATPSPAAAPVSERRTTTVLFGDLVGFTTLSESRDPEDVRELLSTYFEVARTVVGRYGGTIEKFIGDAVMAVWGVPVAHEDDAERAVRAGLDLVAEIAALGESLGAPDLSMRVGLVTGSVAVTLGAVNEGMVAGDAVNTAARVQAAASPGHVWVDQETRGLTAAAISFSDMGEHELKGKAEPVRLFRADAIVAAVGGAQRVDGLEAPMVGREREIREVKELFHATQTDGRARLAVVSGVAGIGKSRLGWEFEKYVDGLSDDVWWHRGRCLSYGEGVAYRAFAEMVRSRVGVLEGESGPVVEERIRDYLGRVASTADEAAWLRPRLLALLTAAGGGFERTDLFASWTTFLERVAADGSPVVLVFEDMQHADSGLVDLVEHLLQACRAPLFVVVLTRPELLEQRPSLATGRRTVVVDLGPLAEDRMAMLVDFLVDDLASNARTAVVQRAEGIPLYAVETVRSLIDRDAVVSQDGRYRFVDHDHRLVDLDQLSAPSSLRTLVAARLDALTPDERRTAQDASVLGLSFTQTGVLALSGLSDFEVDTALDGLVRKGIVATQDDPRSPERGQFHFLQGIVREVAHDTLARRDLRARHLAAADHLEAAGGDDASAIVAQHLVDALAASPVDDDERTELAARARRLLTMAAARAQSLGSPEEALRLTSTALEMGPSSAERAALLQQAAQAAFDNGQHQRAYVQAGEAAEEFVRVDDTVGSLRAQLLVVNALYLLGRIQDGLDVLREVEKGMAGIDVDDQLVLKVHHMRCYAARTLDRDSQLRSAVDFVVFAESTADKRDLALALNQLAIALIDAGSRITHRALLERVIEISRAEGDLLSLCRGLTNVVSESYIDDLSTALLRGVESYDVAIQSGSATLAEVSLVNLAFVRWLHGDWDDLQRDVTGWLELREDTPTTGALRLADAMVRVARGEQVPVGGVLDSDEMWERNTNALYTAHLTAQAGDLATAVVSARESMLAAYPVTEHAWEDFEICWSAATSLAIRAGDLAGLERLVEHAEACWQRSILLTAEVARVRGTLARARGENPEAALRNAIEQHEAYGAPYLLALARHELGEWLVEQGRIDEAASLLELARRTFDELGVAVQVRA